MTYQLRREQVIRASLGEISGFFSEPANLELLTPPWLRFTVLTPGPIEMRAGASIEYRLRVHGMPLRWVSLIEEWQPPNRFVDLQVRGPYRLWRHTHEFEVHEDGTLIRDAVSYSLPAGALGRLAHAAIVRRDLARIFDYRQRQVERYFEATPAGG